MGILATQTVCCRSIVRRMSGDEPILFPGRFWDDLNFLRDQQQTPGGPIAKLILFRLLSKLGPNAKASTWTKTEADMRRGLLISRSTLYAKLKTLANAGLLSYERDGNRFRITICRANFREPEFLPSDSRTGQSEIWTDASGKWTEPSRSRNHTTSNKTSNTKLVWSWSGQRG